MERPTGIIGAFGEVWFKIGWLGVDLFFVLSGFLIGGLLLSEHAKHGTIKVSRFLWRRGLKIYPPYFVFLAYLILMPTAKAIRNGADGWSVFTSEFVRYWANFLFLQNYVGKNPAGHTWTLAVEEHFYLLLPFALAGLAAFRRMRWLVPAALAAVPLCLALRTIAIWTNDPYAVKMSASHLRLDALLFGVAVRGVAQYAPGLFSAFRPWRLMLVLLGVLLWLPNVFVHPSNFWIKTVGLTGNFLGSAAFLIAAFHTHAQDFGRLRAWAVRGATVIAWIGVYSYGIYLWHVTAMGILERVAAGRIFHYFGGNSGFTWLLAVLVVSIGAILSGVFASKIIEWPVLRLRDRFFPSRSGSLPSNVSKEPPVVTNAGSSTPLATEAAPTS